MSWKLKSWGKRHSMLGGLIKFKWGSNPYVQVGIWKWGPGRS